jgi:hypothetical protein
MLRSCRTVRSSNFPVARTTTGYKSASKRLFSSCCWLSHDAASYFACNYFVISFGRRMIEFKASMIWNKPPQSLTDIETCHAFKTNFEIYFTFNEV